MSDAFIQPPANTGVGPLVDTEQLTVSAQTVQRQRIIIADPSGASSKLGVSQYNNQDSNLANSYAIQVQSVGGLYNGATIDRQRAAPGTVGVTAVNTEGTKATYSIAGLISPAATPTDLAILNGSGTKTIRVTRVEVSVAATAAGIADILLIKRSTANSAGSSTTPTPVPHDSGDGPASAIVTQYSANPTAGTSVGNIRSAKIGITAADGVVNYIWSFTERNAKGVKLLGTTQGLAINGNGDALLSGEVIAYSFEWTEE